MIQAYYDESGEYEGGRLVRMTMGGCVAPMTKWEEFEGAWRSALMDEGLSSFHMAEFEAWQPPFDFKLPDGSRDHERHRRLLNRLIDAMTTHIEGFHGFNSHDIPLSGKNAHRIAMEQCSLGAISHVVKEVFHRYGEPIHLVFAKQKHFSERGRRYWQAYYDVHDDRIGSRLEADANCVPQLQAADLFAYEMARHVRVNRPARYSFKRLKEGAHKNGSELTVQVGPFKPSYLSSVSRAHQ